MIVNYRPLAKIESDELTRTHVLSLSLSLFLSLMKTWEVTGICYYGTGRERDNGNPLRDGRSRLDRDKSYL